MSNSQGYIGSPQELLNPTFGFGIPQKAETTAEVIAACLAELVDHEDKYVEIRAVVPASYIHLTAKRNGYKVGTQTQGDVLKFWIKEASIGEEAL